jgi:hypothetical protein
VIRLAELKNVPGRRLVHRLLQAELIAPEVVTRAAFRFSTPRTYIARSGSSLAQLG